MKEKGTKKYLPPEILNLSFKEKDKDKQLLKALDIWGLGIILYRIVFGHNKNIYPSDISNEIGWDLIDHNKYKIHTPNEIKFEEKSENNNLSNGFIEYLDKNNLGYLKVIFNNIFENNPSERITIDDLIKLVENPELERASSPGIVSSQGISSSPPSSLFSEESTLTQTQSSQDSP
tara:strand:- start:50 stop:577 length:528 start_codon:yes stop_codon:yes gene_type:complete